MHLLIDVGNSRIKWAFVSEEYGEDNTTHYGSMQELERYILSINVVETKVLLAAVNQTRELNELLKNSGFYSIKVVKSQVKQAGIENSYEQPERMGIDRWLAMIAAYHRQDSSVSKQGIIVVDAGSALTIDVIDQQGVHQGGYIVPGLVMAQSVLFANTEQIKRYDEPDFAESHNDKLYKLGNNTLQCVEYGVINQQVALIAQVEKQFPEYMIIITGGDGELMASFFPMAIVDENLVLKGLWQVRN